MNRLRNWYALTIYFILAVTVFMACSKEQTTADTSTVPPPNPCAGRNITLVTTSVATAPCIKNGSITVTATGSTGFTYSIDGGGFQSSNTFNNLGQGDHSYLVKDITGCLKSGSANVAMQQPGTLYTAVKAIIINNCINCHNGPSGNGGMDFSSDCNIISSSGRIKIRAVDGNPSFMPTTGKLNQVDMDKITAWITAGGRYSD